MAIFFIFIFIITTILITIFSHLKIDINEFNLVNRNIAKLRIKISVALFNKIDLIKFEIDNRKIQALKENKKIREISRKIEERLLKDYDNIKDIKVEDIKEYLKALKNIKLENIDINILVGTEDASLTAYIVAFLSIVITFLIAKKIQKTKYVILPKYNNQNYLNLTLKCIISIKLVHIINIIKVFLIKGNSNEQILFAVPKKYR